jgi:hypothetical protein
LESNKMGLVEVLRRLRRRCEESGGARRDRKEKEMWDGGWTLCYVVSMLIVVVSIPPVG